MEREHKSFIRILQFAVLAWSMGNTREARENWKKWRKQRPLTRWELRQAGVVHTFLCMIH